MIEYHTKDVLCGRVKTMHRVYHEIRAYIQTDGDRANHMISLLLDKMQSELLEREFYELLPRFDVARHRIEKKFATAPLDS